MYIIENELKMEKKIKSYILYIGLELN